jgi:hypothetical protein
MVMRLSKHMSEEYMHTRCQNPRCAQKYRFRAHFYGKVATCRACGIPFLLIPLAERPRPRAIPSLLLSEPKCRRS